MIIDMHTHTTTGSPCAYSNITDYLQYNEQLRKEGRGVDAIVITEHGVYSPTSQAEEDLSARFGVLILKGVEVNTDYCHMLIYGVKQEHWERLDWAGERTLKAREVIETALRTKGMLAVPAHPFRACPVGGHRDFSGVNIIEAFNGANNDTQDQRALELARELDCLVIGASDAHRVEDLGKCATEFDATIKSMEELVTELQNGKYSAIKRTRNGSIKFQNTTPG